MNMIILWKDSNWILKSHFIATYKSCEWLCIDLIELYPRTFAIQDRGFQLGGEDEGDSGQKILVWARQDLKDENTPFLAQTHLHPPAPCAVLYLCALQVFVYWTCLSRIRQQAFWREGPHHTHLCVFSPDSNASEVSAPWTCWMNGNLWSAFRDRLLFTSIFRNYLVQVVIFCVCTSQHITSWGHKQHSL